MRRLPVALGCARVGVTGQVVRVGGVAVAVRHQNRKNRGIQVIPDIEPDRSDGRVIPQSNADRVREIVEVALTRRIGAG